MEFPRVSNKNSIWMEFPGINEKGIRNSKDDQEK